MNLSSSWLVLAAVVLLFTFGVEVLAESSPAESKQAASGRQQHRPPQLTLKKRQEQLCPNEYHMCWCDYVNSANHARLNGGKNNLVLASQSIMVDCQPSSSSSIHISKPDDTKSNKHAQAAAAAASPTVQRSKLVHNKTTLNEIPRIMASSSGPQSTFKSKNLMNIVYLDLSHTDIREIPSDAFQVRIHTLFSFRSQVVGFP